jgi:hypothetical protein
MKGKWAITLAALEGLVSAAIVGGLAIAGGSEPNSGPSI